MLFEYTCRNEVFLIIHLLKNIIMKSETKTMASGDNLNKMGELFGKMYSYNISLKLYHWHVSGKGSYAEHMALDQAIHSLNKVLDRIVETSYSAYGPTPITLPETPTPTDIVQHSEEFFEYVDQQRELFEKDFSTAIIDDYQEAIQQLLYRLRRLE